MRMGLHVGRIYFFFFTIECVFGFVVMKIEFE